MRTARITAILGLVGLLTWASPSLGRPPAPVREAPTAAMTEKARQLYAEGVKAFGQGRWGDAHAAFLAARALNPHYTIAGNLGMCELKLSRFRDAAEHLAIYTREIRKDEAATAAQRDAAQAAYYEARAKIGTVPVIVSPEGAAVVVDGREAGAAPLADPVFVEPGEHVVEARRDGYVAKKATVVSKAGGIDPVTLALVQVPAAATVPHEEKGPATAAAPGGEGPVARSWVPIVVLGAASVVGLGVGVGMTVASNDAHDDARAQREAIFASGDGCLGSPAAAKRCHDLTRAGERAEDLGNAAVVTCIAAGSLAVAALAYSLWPRTERVKATWVHARPTLGVGSGGISILGVW